MLQRIHIAPDPDAAARIPALNAGPIDLALRAPITVIVGENGCGKTTLLEAVADATRPGSDRGGPVTRRTTLAWASRRPSPCLFIRADRIESLRAALGRRGPLRMADGSWRDLQEQSLGEAILSILTNEVEPSERQLILLDEPEAALSPMRQYALLNQLHEFIEDGRSQIIMATHSPILMTHPAADLLQLDDGGLRPTPLDEVEHWRFMRGFMSRPHVYLRHLGIGTAEN